MSKRICFTGHREIFPQDVETLPEHLRMVLRKAIHANYSDFLCGGALGFDQLAAWEVIELRKKNPQIRLVLFLPCFEQAQNWAPEQKKRYHQLLNEADFFFYVSDRYYSGCMHVRNRLLVLNSHLCVSYQRKDYGGTAYTVNFAQSKGKKVINL